jgi:hypothetical protein
MHFSRLICAGIVAFSTASSFLPDMNSTDKLALVLIRPDGVPIETVPLSFPEIQFVYKSKTHGWRVLGHPMTVNVHPTSTMASDSQINESTKVSSGHCRYTKLEAGPFRTFSQISGILVCSSYQQ